MIIVLYRIVKGVALNAEDNGIIEFIYLIRNRVQKPMAYSTLGEFLEEEIARRKLSNRGLAIGAGVSEFAIRNMLQHGISEHAKDPDPRTLRAVADYLNIDPLRLFRLAGYIPPQKAAPSVRAETIAEVFDRLDEDQQNALLGMAEALVSRLTDKEVLQSVRTPGSRALIGFDVGSPQTLRYMANTIIVETRVKNATELDRAGTISPDAVVTYAGLKWDAVPRAAKERALALAKAKLNLDYDPTMVDPEWRK